MGADPHWNHNTHYHPLLLDLARGSGPGGTVARSALDVGCGEGLLARRLRAAGVPRVVGIDVDAGQVDQARAQSDDDGVRFHRADILATDGGSDGDGSSGGSADTRALGGLFDLVTCVATLHHLPLRPGLKRLRDFVAPGGTLAAVGLHRVAGLELLAVLPAAVVVAVRDRVQGQWEHGAPISEPIETLAEIRAAAREVLPGAAVRRRLYWRYTLLWRAPA